MRTTIRKIAVFSSLLSVLLFYLSIMLLLRGDIDAVYLWLLSGLFASTPCSIIYRLVEENHCRNLREEKESERPLLGYYTTVALRISTPLAASFIIKALINHHRECSIKMLIEQDKLDEEFSIEEEYPLRGANIIGYVTMAILPLMVSRILSKYLAMQLRKFSRV